MIDVKLKRSGGSGKEAKVTSYGQLVTAPLDFSTTYNATAGTANTPVNLIVPKTGKVFIINTIMLYANQSVSNTADATVVLYEATSSTTATESKSILSTAMVRSNRVVLNNVNILVSEGVWVNLKTDDDDVYGTIIGYYVNI